MKRMWKKRKLSVGFILPSLIGVFVFAVLPMFITFLDAFRQGGSAKWNGFRGFYAVIQNPAYQLALKNTIIFAAVNLVIVLSLGLGISRILAEYRWGKWICVLFSIPMVIPTVSITLLGRLLFDNHGIINRLLYSVDTQPIQWFDTRFATVILAMLFLWKNVGFTVLIWVVSIQSVVSSVKEAAIVDGADNKALFAYIVLPNLQQAFLLNVVILIISVFKIFREAYLIGGDYPHESIYMMQHLFNNWFREYEFEKIACGGILYMLLLIFIICGIALLGIVIKRRCRI